MSDADVNVPNLQSPDSGEPSFGGAPSEVAVKKFRGVGNEQNYESTPDQDRSRSNRQVYEGAVNNEQDTSAQDYINIPHSDHRAEAEPGSKDRRTCIMMGPAKSGKTFLLLALGRACYLPTNDDLELGFVPEESVAELMEYAVEIITGEKRMEASRKANDYSFEIRAKAVTPDILGRKKRINAALNLTFSDGPGGALFPEEVDQAMKTDVERWQPKLVADARGATSLIFCVDATAPSLTLLEKRLPRLIAKMTFQQRMEETEEPNIWDRLRRRPPQISFIQRQCLNVDRFLILLTQIDKLCAPHEKPRLMAEMIDPIEQVKETLGLPLLKMIQSALKPSAKFAVGVTSALGFNPINGRPLADQFGVPRKASMEGKDEVYRRWTPFGVRDAIFFISTGRPVGSVRLIKPEDLRASEAMPVDVDSYYLNQS